MDYKITMPQLSDSMSEGKLVEWKVKIGDKVSSGDVIADIESDKAVIELQTFKDGIVKELLLKENDDAKVGSVIAIIDTDIKNNKIEIKKKDIVKKEERSKKTEIPNDKSSKSSENMMDFLFDNDEKNPSLPEGISTPVAKQKASKFGINIQKLQKENKLPVPAFEKDIFKSVADKYFTPKAKQLLQEYGLEVNNFKFDHKIDTEEIKKYIKENNIPKVVKISANQKAIINTVTKSWQRPVYHIYEEVEVSNKDGIKLSANILKALSNSMQKFEFSRTVFENNILKIYPNSNISVALSKGETLYMVVLKNSEDLSLKEINDWLKEIKTKEITLEDLQGSTFGVSNLGMFKIDSFDALINDNDAGIVAFGALINNKMKVTFTFDHRIVNGAMAAQFVMDFKKEIKNV